MNLLRKLKDLGETLILDPASRAVIRGKLTYLSPEKLRRLHRAMKQVYKLEGDFLEFGVALGGSGILLAKGKGESRRFLGFDVFGMIPPPTSEKDDASSKDRYQAIVTGASKGIRGGKYYGYRENLFTEVKESFARYGVPVDGERIALYRGFFQDLWPTVFVVSIALAHIDCDWYDPVRFCLQAVADKMSDGGIIIIDDYNDYGGCRTAVDEFIKERPDFTFEPGANPFLRRKLASRHS